MVLKVDYRRSEMWTCENDPEAFIHTERNTALTRIPLVDSNDPATDPLAVDVLKSVSRHRNRTVNPNVYRAMANHPDALRTLVDFGTAVYFENSLTPAQRELAYLTASVTNDCHY